jgi:polyisoprenyl-phosphate glycosyltransferase
MDRNQKIRLDVVIPAYNEESMVDPLLVALSKAFSVEQLESHGVASVRIIFVDDGSTDRTVELLQQRTKGGVPADIVRLSRNFGHQSAVSAGLVHSSADVVAVIDADLQDPPELILDMVDKWRDGFDVVYGERRNRKENFFKKAAYWAFYRIISFLSEIDIPRDAGDFSLMDRRVVDAIVALPEKLRFVRGLRTWVGFRQTALPYDRPSRAAGETKYPFSRLYRLATDGIASLSIRPLRIAQLITMCYSMMFLALVVVFVVMALNHETYGVSLWTLLTYTLIVSGNAAICLCLYILGAYVGRGYLEEKARPTFIVAEVIGCTTDEPASPGHTTNDSEAKRT